MRIVIAAMLAWIGFSTALFAWQESATGNQVDAAAAIPIYKGDITDHPYRVIGPVRAEVHWNSWLGARPSPGDLYAALWRVAQAKGAEAVVNVTYAQRGAGSIVVAGIAVRFLPPCAPASPGDPLC